MPTDKHWLETRLEGFFPISNGRPNANGISSEPNATVVNHDNYLAATLTGVIHDLRQATEGNRNETLNKAAYRLGQFVGGGSLDETHARAQLQDAGLACGLQEAEIHKTISSGIEAGKHDPVILERDHGIPDTVTDASTLPQPADWRDILSDKTPETDWLIDGIIERGRLHALFAPSKTHKSLIVQYLSGELARTDIVMYLDLENSRADLRTRFLDMGHTVESLANLLYFPFPVLPALDTYAGGTQLVAMAEHYQPALIILDTTSRVIQGGENDSDTFRALYRYALVRIKALGIAVLRIDHAGKDVALGQRGSSAKADDVDTVWLLIKQEDDRFTLKCTHQRSGHHPDVINLQKVTEPLLRFTRVDDEDTNAPLGVDGIIRELDRLGAPSGMGRQAAEKLLRSAGKNVRQRIVQQAVEIRRLEIDAASLGQNAPEMSGSFAGSRPKPHDPQLLDQSLDHTQSERPVNAGHPLDHSNDPANQGLIQGVAEQPGSLTGGAISPPVIQAPDARAALDLFGVHEMRVSIVECQLKLEGCIPDTEELYVVGSTLACRSCAYVDANRRDVRCCQGKSLRMGCKACVLFSGVVNQ